MNRKLHRWLAGTLAAPFLYVCVTGTATTLSEIADPASVRRSRPALAREDMPPLPPELGRVVGSAVADALRRHPHTSPGVIEVEVRRTPKGLRLQVWAEGLQRTLVYDANARLLVESPSGQNARPVKLSATLQDLHSGLRFGRGAQGFVLAAGLALAAMAVTGIWLYAEMLAKLRAAGRKAIFWK